MSAFKYQHLALYALGDPTRREIFEKLADGPLSVAHLAEGLPVSRPAVSQHLKVLCEAKLVSMQKEGTRSMYRIENEGIAAIRSYLDRFWDEALGNFKALAEKVELEKSAEPANQNPKPVTLPKHTDALKPASTPKQAKDSKTKIPPKQAKDSKTKIPPKQANASKSSTHKKSSIPRKKK